MNRLSRVSITIFCMVWIVIFFMMGYKVGLDKGKQKRFNLKYQDIFTISAYCPGECCCGKWSDGYTASGHKIHSKDDTKIVAADKRFSFGTILYIQDIGKVRVEDRGGAIKDNRLDLLYCKYWSASGDHTRALKFGIKKKKVWILKSKRKK